VSLQTQLWPEALLTRGDRVQLQQVVLNLMMNALDAMAECKGTRRIVVHTGRDNGAIRVAVEDSGPGVDSHSAPNVFQPFYTTKPQGMGMGLSISRSIIEAHGGTLTLQPDRAEGA